MIGVVVSGLGMEKDRQAIAVEHQPRKERPGEIGRKRDLIHRLGMRPDQFVMPAAKLGAGKFRGNTLTQTFRPIAGLFRIVIDMRVIGLDRPRITFVAFATGNFLWHSESKPRQYE